MVVVGALKGAKPSPMYDFSLQSLDGLEIERRERILAQQNWMSILSSVQQVRHARRVQIEADRSKI